MDLFLSDSVDVQHVPLRVASNFQYFVVVLVARRWILLRVTGRLYKCTMNFNVGSESTCSIRGIPPDIQPDDVFPLTFNHKKPAFLVSFTIIPWPISEIGEMQLVIVHIFHTDLKYTLRSDALALVDSTARGPVVSRADNSDNSILRH